MIRGGSASTFASNSPGGIINFQSKTGDSDGGAVQVGSGLDFDQKRIDFDYGAHVSDSLRFHVGGFYRQGEGPRRTGFTAKKGGQIKFNITQQFANGYVRLYGKVLDDRTPVYEVQPLGVTGTNADPVFRNVPGYEVGKDAFLSRYHTTNVTLDENNNLETRSNRDGQHVSYKSVGAEAQFDVAGWTVVDRFRFADVSSSSFAQTSLTILTPQALSGLVAGGPGATFSYATGPLAGTAIANPGQLNGNGLLVLAQPADNETPNLENATNDLRLSRVWGVGSDELTTTVGRLRGADLRLLATDLAPHVVDAVRTAHYAAQTCDAIPREYRDAWLRAEGDGFTMAPEARAMVTARVLNLFDAWPMRQQYDAIFCRNVMIYFDDAAKAELEHRLVELLAPGGHLYIGHSERLIGPAAARMRSCGQTIYVKSESPSR